MAYGASLHEALRQGASMAAGFSRARNPPTCQCGSPLDSTSSSTSTSPRPSGLDVPPTILTIADEVIE